MNSTQTQHQNVFAEEIETHNNSGTQNYGRVFSYKPSSAQYYTVIYLWVKKDHQQYCLLKVVNTQKLSKLLRLRFLDLIRSKVNPIQSYKKVLKVILSSHRPL